jgi:hypothetical protein
MKPLWRPVAIVAVGGAALLGGIAVQTNRESCDRRVDARDDGRAVWLYLVAREPDRRDDPDVVRFVKFLDDRLPPLHCNFWGSPSGGNRES